jgi:acid phosphatase type 7
MWILAFVLFAGQLAAEITALYLSWYGDPLTTMAIQWHTPESNVSDEVEIQELGGTWKAFKGSHQQIEDRLVHKILLDHLSPDTEYSFRLGADPAIYKFRTAPNTLTSPLLFCTGGDLYQTPDLFRKMCRVVAAKRPLFVVLGGDIAYALTHNPFKFRSTAKKQWFSFLQEWKEEMITPEGQVIPFLIVPGNHDLSPSDNELFFDLFAFPEKKLYRAVDFGNYLSLILLDSAIFEPIEGMQTEWLDKALSDRKRFPFQFAIYHKAAYPSVYPYNGEIPKQIRTYWCPLFDKHNLQAAFENHNHAFKRTFPIKNNKMDNAGVIYLGDGCWGAAPRRTNSEWYLAKREQKNNVYMIEISKESAKIEAVGLQGEEIDSLTFKSRL